jgi:hypothetical protein
MHFIKRSDCPQYLTDNQVKWTAPWVAHYGWQKGVSAQAEQPKKPTDGHWRDDKIRLVLIKDFHNNCGYCGESLPTPKKTGKKSARQDSDQEIMFTSKGDVDHLVPKAIDPESVYQWSNYIWSCKPCNQLKNEFYSRQYSLLNPSDEYDCATLIFIEDTGQYALNKTVADNENWQQRFKNSELKTLLNADETCKKRCLRISTLCQRFSSITSNLSNVVLLADFPGDVAVITNLQAGIDSELTEIKEIMSMPDFYFLAQEKYQLLLEEYPQVATLLT